MKEKALIESFIELVRRAATCLPRDVRAALRAAHAREEGVARETLGIILENVALAEKSSAPLCQDTGLQTWTVRYPRRWRAGPLRAALIEATREATRRGYLRPNAVDPLTGANSEDNTGAGHPIVDLVPWEEGFLAADLLLKGGGCENVSGQASLPDGSIGAGRDADGVRKAVLKLILAAQGKGCSPGVAGVAVGGDRQSGFKLAKAQLARALGDRSRDRRLAALERALLGEANALGIGPMGFGGKATLLGVKMATAARHPASFYVTVSYSCWALRRWSMRADAGGEAVYAQKPFTGAAG